MTNPARAKAWQTSALYRHEMEAGNKLIVELLEKYHGNGAAVAKELGVTRSLISWRAKTFNLQPFVNRKVGRHPNPKTEEQE